MNTSKKMSESQTEQSHIVMSTDINGAGRLFGGRLMEWIDIAAAVTARRHCNRDVVTVSVDSLRFKAPAHVNDTVVLNGRVVYTGRTSMDVKVDVYVETLGGESELISVALLSLVALDENEMPTPVPTLELENEKQHADWEKAVERRERFGRS